MQKLNTIKQNPMLHRKDNRLQSNEKYPRYTRVFQYSQINKHHKSHQEAEQSNMIILTDVEKAFPPI